jgi:hypothetical protein
MTYTSSTRSKRSVKPRDIAVRLFDPTLIQAARNIYRTFCNVQSDSSNKPFGVVIHIDNHRGQLVFRQKPILLPRECFIPLDQIEAEIY